MNLMKNKIIDALKEVYDPEIPINVYDLGLIYEIKVDGTGKVNILMTLTSPTCPTADFIKEMISDAVLGVKGVKSIDIELTFEPMWTPDKITKEAREELGFEEDKTIDIGVKKVFNESNTEEKICFNCGITENQRPIVDAHYKKENVGICVLCLNKF